MSGRLAAIEEAVKEFEYGTSAPSFEGWRFVRGLAGTINQKLIEQGYRETACEINDLTAEVRRQADEIRDLREELKTQRRGTGCYVEYDSIAEIHRLRDAVRIYEAVVDTLEAEKRALRAGLAGADATAVHYLNAVTR